MNSQQAAQVEKLCQEPSVCPANAYSMVMGLGDVDPHIDSLCLRDVADNGVCWCGKLRAAQFDGTSQQGEDQ